MYISVIPYEHSLGTRPLTYILPEDFAPVECGSLVEVPVRQGVEYGVVSAIDTGEPIPGLEVRPIHRVIVEGTFLAPYQVRLIEHIASRYMIPIHRVLGFVLTRNILRRLEKKEFAQALEPVDQYTSEHTPIRDITLFMDTLITPEILSGYIQPYTVIVCPDDMTVEYYRRSFPESEYFFFSSDMTDVRRAQAWIDIKNKKYKIIFGNRKILYYNISAYKKIIYLEDGFGREYFHYPIRIQYDTLLRNIAESSVFDISILSSMPRLSTLAVFHDFSLTTYSPSSAGSTP